MSAVDEVAVQAQPPAPRRYGWSALWSGLRGLFRAWPPILLAVVLNAVVQALLTVPGAPAELTVGYVAVCLVSYIVLLAAIGLVSAAALEAVEGRVSLSAAIGRLRAHAGRYVLWGTVVIVAVFIGMLLYVVPGIVIFALTPFVVLAAVDGAANPLAVNFRVIRERFGRWLITVLLMAVPFFLAGTFAALFEFFLRGAPSSIVVWLIVGLLAAWFSCAWAFIYRSSRAGTAA